MNARKNAHRRDDFERLVREARFERAMYLGNAIADVTAAVWKGITRAAAALRSSFGPARPGDRLAAKRSLATR